ncbi:MAG: bifunctional heptose 7-phosphate kinase/heptose 1-phosphate adenyltransferase [bacterium]
MPSVHDPTRLLELLHAWRGKKIVVAGDFVLDCYVFGRPARLSREAPVVVLEHDGEDVTPGGAGNATRNVEALGGTPLPVGVVGDDANGERLVASLSSAGIDTSGLLRVRGRATTAKTRILAGGIHSSKQQILRIDRGGRAALDAATNATLVGVALDRLRVADAVLFSDYGYGALFPEVRDPLLAAACARALPSCADSRFDLAGYSGVWIATPNEEEAVEATGARGPAGADESGDPEAALLARLGARALLITRGSRGMRLLLADGDRLDIPVIGPDEVADVTGAGDTVASAVTLGLSAGGDPRDAARLANAAASVVVMKRGAATATPNEVHRALGAARVPSEGVNAPS